MQLHTCFQKLDWNSPLGWTTVFILGLLGAVVLYLIGPLPLLAYGLQCWAAGSSWDWKDHWASVRGSAVCFGLLFLLICALLILPVPFFRHALQDSWRQSALLGVFSLWPPVPATLAARWLLPLPLTPALALILERLYPLTNHPLIRVLLPDEKARMHKRQAEAVAQRAVHLVAEQANAQATAVPPREPEPQPKAKRKQTSTGQDQPKARGKLLYPRKKAQQRPTTSPSPEASHKAEAAESATPVPSEVSPSKPKIDWSRVQE